MFVLEQSGLTTSSRGEAASECFCWHLSQLPRNMTQQSHLATVALKRKPVAMGKRAPRAPPIVEWFCQRPWPESVADSVALLVCRIALVAARAPLAVLGEGAQHDSKPATTPGGPEGVRPVGKSPTFGGPVPLLHAGRSNLLAQ
jgi:hypothetical protein